MPRPCIAPVVLTTLVAGGLACAAPKAEPPPPEPEATPTLPVSTPAAPAESTNWGDGLTEDKKPFSVKLTNDCSDVVDLFFGVEPRPHSNYYTTMNGHSQSSRMMMAGDRVWIVDDEQYGIASADVPLGTAEVVIDASCASISAY